MGFPFGHGLHATITTMRLCSALEVDAETASRTYYAALLTHVGCTVDADVNARIFKGGMTENVVPRMYGSPFEATLGALSSIPDPDAPWAVRAGQMVMGLPRAARFRKPHFTALCEVAEMLAAQLGLPRPIQELFHFLTERWDGSSNLRRARGEEVPLPMRIAHVGRDATYQSLLGDHDHVIETMRSRSGGAFDPRVADTFVAEASEILDNVNPLQSMWEEMLDAEPRPRLTLEGDDIDRALGSIGAFADLVSPHLSGHSVGVGNLARAAAQLAGFETRGVRAVRRAGYVLDVGKVSVHPRIWDKRGSLDPDEWEQVRLHTYHTERVLDPSPYLSSLGEIASTHHERLDGSGYHRGIGASSLPRANRLLACADAFRSKIEPRPYRQALRAEDATRLLSDRAREGKLDGEMVAAVAEAAGSEVPEIHRPAGLTEREAEVLSRLAHGMQTKQVARKLDISIKTADHHIQSAYRKIGVSTRAAATLFAIEHGMVEPGDLPTTGPRGRG